MARLHFLNDPGAGRTYPLVLEKTSVGRSPHHGLVIDHPSVSADHCEILVYGPEVIVREHGSTNGTFVEGVRVVGQRPVKSGQIIRFGEIEARLELEPSDQFEEDTASGQSAIHAYGKWKRGLTKPRPEHAAGPALPELEVPDDLDETVVFHKPAVPAQPSQPESRRPALAPNARAAARRRWTLLGLFALGVALGVGLWLRGCK